MITKLQNPFAAAGLSLVLSIALGVGLCYKELQTLLNQAVLAAQPKQPTELKRKGWDFWTIEIENLANELKEERLRMKKQAEGLDQRAARLAAEEKEFAKLRADVESLRKEIADRVIEIKADEIKNLRALSATYSALQPRATVAIFKEMDDATAVKILSLMKADVIAPIFDEMSRSSTADSNLARRAAVLSEKLRLMKAAKTASSP
jgi:flagellar motility protein MotE (MotC chaperone)